MKCFLGLPHKSIVEPQARRALKSPNQDIRQVIIMGFSAPLAMTHTFIMKMPSGIHVSSSWEGHALITTTPFALLAIARIVHKVLA
jgi:hypothetical protein